MTKANILSLVEDLLDSTTIPLSEYVASVSRDNGNYTFTIFHCPGSYDVNRIDDMAELSNIFNTYSSDWSVIRVDEKRVITLKVVIE